MTKLIIVGGFLGAGKTTLLMESAKILTAKGYKVGLITNDQAEGLVDSVYLSQSGSRVLEVSGSCFCCNFDGFVESIRQAKEVGGCDVVIAEPVGSCTDLTATIIRPLRTKYPELAELAPLTVLTDPNRLQNSLNDICDGLHESASYIYRKQLEDAGTILIGKSDLLDERGMNALIENTKYIYKDAVVEACSSKKGLGLSAWLDMAMASVYSESKPVEMDYDIYAEGEAVLGWLNTELLLASEMEVDWATWFRKMISNLAAEIDKQNLVVGHVKAIIQADSASLLANITGTKETLEFRGKINPGCNAKITINARVQTQPEVLETLVFKVFNRSLDWQGERHLISLNTLSPGRPNPTYRYEFCEE
jgi:Ni2+-binding GTPase involved in maturation of urease and hydrogenase